MEYTVIRSKRKTIAIHITRDAAVEVRVPLKLAQSEIERFVQLKKDWIAKHLAVISERANERAAFVLNYGDKVFVMGKPCVIVAYDGKRAKYADGCFYMPKSLDSNQIKAACVRLYKLIAKDGLVRRTMDYASCMGIESSAVKINSATTRWGSCSGRDNINFSWRLIMAADDVIDYVVVHELAHIVEHNHSDRFWAVVQSVLPDYKTRQKRLKALQAVLAKEDWS